MSILLLLVANFAFILVDGKKNDTSLIPDDIICPFCIALVQRFQQTTRQNSDYRNFFKSGIFSSCRISFISPLFQILCESLSAKSRKNYNFCIESFDDVTVEKLKTLSAENLCKNQKLCPVNYKSDIKVECIFYTFKHENKM
uniref:Saposin B-type domain-containing protein n=1 Tax=Elaeophora elaphi TaxID=1147741 RepID=A0A0R3RKY4_9BILA